MMRASSTVELHEEVGKTADMRLDQEFYEVECEVPVVNEKSRILALIN